MAFSERIKLVIDVATGNATGPLSKLSSDLAKADGAFNKTKAVGASMWSSLKANAALGAAGLASALGGFAVKAVADFQKVALGAGEMSDALGISTEDASRLQEVAQDVGIGVDTLQSAMGRMNRAAASTPEAFNDIGASLVRARDGSLDVSATFQSAAEALDRIPDAATRAAAGQKIFGRGWMEISELIESGAVGIRDAMASVEEGKIISPEEVAKAREFRDEMDALIGKLEVFALKAGQLAVDAVGWAEPVGAGFTAIGDGIQRAEDKLDAFFGTGEVVQKVGDGFAESARQLTLLNGAMGAFGSGGTGEQFAEVETSVLGMTGAFTEGASAVERLADVGDTAMLGLGAIVDQAGAAFERNAQAAESFSLAIGSVDWGAAEAAGAVTGMSAYNQQLFGLANIAAASEGAIDGLSASLAENDASFDLSTEGGRANQQALEGVAASLEGRFVAAYDAANGSLAAFQASGAGIRQTFIDQAVAAGISVEAAAGLADQLGLTAGDYEARFTLSGIEEAKLRLDLLGSSIGLLSADAQRDIALRISTGDFVGALQVAQDALQAIPPTAQTTVSAPGAQQTAADLDAAQRAADAIPETAQTSVASPGAIVAAQQMYGAQRAADAIPESEQTSVSAPGADNSAGQLNRVTSMANTIPASKSTTVSARDAASSVISGVAARLAALRDRVVTVRVNTVGGGTPVFRTGAGVYQRHSGGPVEEGRPYVVGGVGAEELFVPGQTGRVLSSSETKEAAHDAGLGGGGTTLVIEGNVYGDSHLRQIFTEMTREQQRRVRAGSRF